MRVLLTTREVAERAGVTQPAVHYWVKKGYLSSEVLDGVRLFDEDEVETYLASRVPDPSLLTAEDAAFLAGVELSSIHRWAREGHLPIAGKLHGKQGMPRSLFRKEDVLAAKERARANWGGPRGNGGWPREPSAAQAEKAPGHHASAHRGEWLPGAAVPAELLYILEEAEWIDTDLSHPLSRPLAAEDICPWEEQAEMDKRIKEEALRKGEPPPLRMRRRDRRSWTHRSRYSMEEKIGTSEV